MGDPGERCQPDAGARQVWCIVGRHLSVGLFLGRRHLQIGNSPRRIDIITTIDGVKFDHAYANRKTFAIEGLQIPVISLEDLIANKRASGRRQDLADLEKLESQLKGQRTS